MHNGQNIITHIHQTPCGALLLGSFGNSLCLCDWLMERPHNHVENRLRRMLGADFEQGCTPTIETTTQQLEAYFAGERQTFDMPLLFAGTAFQKTVWNILLKIPFGKTVCYSEIAKAIGRPRAVRAVAVAIGANAISVIAPCHRVVGSDSSLTGYRGGLGKKEYLLRLEHAI